MRAQQPDGKRLLGEAFRVLDAAERDMLEKERVAVEATAALEKARSVHAKADARVNELIALASVGRASDPSGEPANKTNTSSNGSTQKPKGDEGKKLADDRRIPIFLRIGLLLVENNELDYDAAALRLWGPGIPRKVYKNRISTHISRLVGIVKALGDNRFEVNEAALMVKVREALPGEASS